jgi:D-cysteine desulfhydrase
LDRLVGAEIRFLSHDEYADRTACLSAVAQSIGGNPYVIPEGGSNGLGALGYYEAMREVRAQLDFGLGGGKPYDVIVHACGSGGTAAGVALGAKKFAVADRVLAVCVCDDAAYFQKTVSRILSEARGHVDEEPAAIDFDDTVKGPRYGVMSDSQRSALVAFARASGIILDPVYTGKAMFGLVSAVRKGRAPKGSRVLFLHTGGLPGMLASGDAFEREIA